MIYQLKKSQYDVVRSLWKEAVIHPVIFGVIEGNNLGDIYVNHKVNPSVALIWAYNEMFYLIGKPSNDPFLANLLSFILREIKPRAILIGDETLNLELYPLHLWTNDIDHIFNDQLSCGFRVPFQFDYEHFNSLHEHDFKLADGYVHKEINEQSLIKGEWGTVEKEILKFWPSLNDFFDKGIGISIWQNDKVVGTCISVFVAGDEHEIGINTYNIEDRGKGLATFMAFQFIQHCLEFGGKPHWTTESFRKDSIAIAQKVGFHPLQEYKSFFVPFKNLK